MTGYSARPSLRAREIARSFRLKTIYSPLPLRAMLNKTGMCLPPFTDYRRRGLASLASGEVMSANETASEVRTSITLGTRAPSAS